MKFHKFPLTVASSVPVRLEVRITWASPDDDYNLIIWRGNECVTDASKCNETVDGSQFAGTTEERVVVLDAMGDYTVQVTAFLVTDSDYVGTARLSTGDTIVPLIGEHTSFAPATIVSAHFLGAEPQLEAEREPSGSSAATHKDRIFVDWPLTTNPQIGQLSRSIDGGVSFRLLYDRACAQRSRPNCGSGGGSDTDSEVNPADGTLYFSDQAGLVANEVLASSTDHGDSFPAEREHAITTYANVDRQWLGTAGRGVIKTQIASREVAVDALLTTRLRCRSSAGGGAIFVNGIDRSGRLIPQPVPQLPPNDLRCLVHAGPPIVDDRRGLIYQPYEERYFDSSAKNEFHSTFRVAVVDARSSDYRDPSSWRTSLVTEDDPQDFPWMALDAAGNAYAVWIDSRSDDRAVYYSFSSISDPENDPEKGGFPGSKWSPKIRITPPDVTSSVFATIEAGDPGRIAIAYMGSREHVGSSGDAEPTDGWNTYAAVVTGATTEPVVHSGVVSHRLGHVGPICSEGALRCAGGDRSLLDLIDVDFDQEGRVSVAFMDNNSTFGKPRPTDLDQQFPFAHFAKQISGPTLLEGGQVNISVPEGSSKDLAGDSTWPNTIGPDGQGNGRYLPSLDLLGATLSLEGTELVAMIPIAGATFTQDLVSYNLIPTTNKPAFRQQYVLRFATGNDIFHLSMESLAGGARRFYGGRLDGNDHVVNGLFVMGAAYNADATIPVSGSVRDNVITLRAQLPDLAKLSEPDIGPGSGLFSVTAFAMAGPTEPQGTTIHEPMRTVDATPPFDATLTQVSASPTPTVSGSPTPTVSPSPSPSASPSPTTSSSPEPASVVLSPAEATSEPGRSHEVTALVTDAHGAPVPGADVEWGSSGVGELSVIDSATDENGTARALLTSEERGDQLVTAATTSCSDGGACSATAVKHWGPDRCDVFGTSGNDLLEGTDLGEVICGFGGSDVLLGNGGDDVLLGGRGRDRLFGGTGNDLLRGVWGDDELRGQRARDRLRAGRGNDHLFGGRGRDHLQGGPGADRLRGGRGRDVCRPGRGPDRVRACE